jgi:hypothetical protein
MILEIAEAIHSQNEALGLEPDLLHSFGPLVIVIGRKYPVQ